MTEFQAYKMYLALKAHFQTDDYDVVKMQGRIRASRKSFDGAGKEFAFRRLVKLYSDEEICNFMVSNFITGNHWGGVFDIQASQRYADWKRRNESLGYVFEQELTKLFEEAADDGVVNIFTAEPGKHPYILKAYLRQTVGPETLVILNRLTDFTTMVNLDSDPVWPDVKRLIKKYRPFVKYQDKYQAIYERVSGQTFV